MAIWQFLVVLVPDSWAEAHDFNAAWLYGEEGYDTECAWRDSQPADPSFQKVLSAILPPSESWHEDLLTWGDAKEHDIQVWHEQEKVAGIDIRLDLNQCPLDEMVGKVVGAAKALGCVLFFPELRAIVEPSELALTKAIGQSRASRFVANPRAFLAQNDN